MRFVLLIGALTIAGCSLRDTAFSLEKGERVKAFFGNDVWNAMEEADMLQAYRLMPGSGEKPLLGGAIHIVRAPMDPGEDWLKLFALLEDPRSYDWNAKPSQSPVPDALFRFITQDNRTVELFIDFDTDFIALEPAGSETANWVSMHPVRQWLVELCKRVFIDDDTIQKLDAGISPGALRRF